MFNSAALSLAVVVLPLSSLALPSLSLRADTSDVPGTFSIPVLYPVNNNAKFVATFAVGSEKTEMQVVMDTGSGLTWLYGPNDVAWGGIYMGGPFPCHRQSTPYYSPNTSTTSSLAPQEWIGAYGGGSKFIYGDNLATDTLSPVSNKSGPRLPFSIASRQTVRGGLDPLCDHFPYNYDGIFGIGTSKNKTGYSGSGSNLRFNVQHPLAPQVPLIDSASMSVFLRKGTTTPVLQNMTGEVLMGGIDTSAFVGPLTQIAGSNQNSEYGYTIPFPRLTVAGRNVTFDDALAEGFNGCLVDSGTARDIWPVNLEDENYNYAPDLFKKESGLLNLTDANGGYYWGYPSACALIPVDATFDFAWSSPSGKEVNIKVPIRNYARDPSDLIEEACRLNLDTGYCVLGANFLSAAYLAVDDDTAVVALAQAGEGVGGRVAIKSNEGIPGLVI